MQVLIRTISAVRPHGDNLTIVTVDNGQEVVANLREDGTPRWREGEPCIYVPEGTIVPEDVLRERGYWDEEKGRGLLEGKKGNRVKMRRFAGFESRGLLFKVGLPGQDWSPDGPPPGKPFWITRESLAPADDNIYVGLGDNVAEFLGITEHVAG